MDTLGRWRSLFAAGLLLLCAAISALALEPGRHAKAQAAQLPPPPPGMARVWFLRQYEPGESLAQPRIYINGAPIAASLPGTIFYRDLPPGNYAFSVESCGQDVNQFTSLALAAGSQAELEIQSLSSFKPLYCPRDWSVFYVRPVAPRFLQYYLPQLRYLGPA